MESALIITYIGLCVGVFYSSFCRLVKMDKHTALSLRFAIFLKAITSVALVFAVISWGYNPSWWICLALASTFINMIVFRKAWEDGVPIWAKKWLH